MPEVVAPLIESFDLLPSDAKVRALELFLATEDEEIFHDIEDKLVTLIKEEEVLLPVEQLTNYPVFLRGVVDKTIEKLESIHYKYMMYEFIYAIHESDLDWEYKKQTVLPILLADYKELRDEYLSYDKDYHAKFVYTSWKESYFTLRYHMNLLIQLMNYYYSMESVVLLKEALHFHDPVIREKACHVCIEKNIKVEEQVLMELSENLESAEAFYWDLKSRNREHLYPIKEKKQPLIAQSKLFTHLVYLRDDEGKLLDKFPEHIQVMDSIETVNQYNQPIRYYLMSFKELNTEYVAWVGGFSLEDGDDTAHVWEGTYTDFVESNLKSIEDHKQDFFSRREGMSQKYHEEIHYESSPKLSKGLWFFYALLITHWVRVLLNGIDEEVYISIGFTLLGLFLTAYEWWKVNRSKVSIVGHDVVINKGKNTKVIQIQDIKKVKYNKKQIQIFNKENNLQLQIPLKWVRYDEFSYVLRELTHHLRERPFIEE
ncbi:hypothetical protein [Sutcliffiella deserti]|uniref:hypothetical protein n=1 Tax=Sutcliffiella deserti TaxID=2875501 RepID=UPI001CBBBDE7|nr:hypothetical protein [Sutcliffiella deserti]